MKHPQLALDIGLNSTPTLANFLVGSNGELLMHIQDIIRGAFEHAALYIWGHSGVGKTHLLKSLSAAQCARYLLLEDFDKEIEVGETRWFLVENVHIFNLKQQQTLFHLYNYIRTSGRAKGLVLVLTANCPPMKLSPDFLPDLRTRLGWDLVYQLKVLSDAEKTDVLFEQAAQRGFTLSRSVVEYMLVHLSRNLSQLHVFLQHLDTYSLQKKQAVTVPLLREWLEFSQQPQYSDAPSANELIL